MSAKSHRGRLGQAVNLAIRKLGSRKRASRAGPPPHPPSLPRFLPAQRESLWVPNRQQKRSQLRDAEGRVGGGEGGLGRREACRGRLEDLSAPAGRKENASVPRPWVTQAEPPWRAVSPLPCVPREQAPGGNDPGLVFPQRSGTVSGSALRV